jgi:hypothetical protein
MSARRPAAHGRRAKRARRLRALRDADTQYGPDTSKVVHTYRDGWTIRRLDTITELWREGALMKHCLQNTNPDDVTDDPRYAKRYSLRDPDNHPHVTIVHLATSIDGHPPGASFVHGHANSYPPKPAYLQRISEWLDTLPGGHLATLPAQTGTPAAIRATAARHARWCA